MTPKQSKTKSRPSPVCIRLKPAIRSQVLTIAEQQNRTAANVVVYIVGQYLSFTKGKLLSNEELSNFFANQEGTPAYAEI